MNDRLEIASRLVAAHAANPHSPNPDADVVLKWALALADLLIAREHETRKEEQS